MEACKGLSHEVEINRAETCDSCHGYFGRKGRHNSPRPAPIAAEAVR